MKMKITKVKNDKTLNLVDFFCGDTFLYQNKVCMVVAAMDTVLLLTFQQVEISMYQVTQTLLKSNVN